VLPLLSISDLFLLPSSEESFGLSALEAMACEVPVVASRVGGIPEVVVDGVCGFLHRVDAADDMAESALRVLTDPGLHSRMAAAARRRVCERFSSGLVVPVYEACYERVLAS
jgi:glycosyltransferase involved in cell wall biosynthesis